MVNVFQKAFKQWLFVLLFVGLLISSSAFAGPQCGGIFQSQSVRGLPLISMDSRYQGEDRGLYVDPVTKRPWQVKYFTAVERAPYELIVKDGFLWDRQGRKAESEYDAEVAEFSNSLLVIDKNHRIFSLPFEERGKFHHSTLSGGQEVLFAGTISMSGGRIREISDGSGHYKPSVEQTLIAIRELKRMGLDLSSMKLTGRVAQALGKTYVMTPKEVAPFLLDK